uniref:Uncharacterized protein n=1 Tax=Escherichia coli TaxID=562 RepID=A0A6M4P2F0_ECOLX|nr:hypothetical protein G6846_00102 [Escherichia coli]
MPAFEWVHVQLHQQKGMISLSPPTICNSARSGSLTTGPTASEIHAAHATHAAARRHRRLVLLRGLGHHGFGGDHQARDGGGVLQRGAGDLGKEGIQQVRHVRDLVEVGITAHGCDAALLVQEEIAPVAIGLVALHFRAVKVQVFLAGTFQHVRHAQRRSGAAKTFVCSSMI